MAPKPFQKEKVSAQLLRTTVDTFLLGDPGERRAGSKCGARVWRPRMGEVVGSPRVSCPVDSFPVREMVVQVQMSVDPMLEEAVRAGRLLPSQPAGWQRSVEPTATVVGCAFGAEWRALLPGRA